MKVKSDRHSKFPNLSKWREEAWKYQGFKGIQTGDLPHTGAMLHQLSCEATQCVAERPDRGAAGSRRSRVRIPLKPWYFPGFFLPIA